MHAVIQVSDAGPDLEDMVWLCGSKQGFVAVPPSVSNLCRGPSVTNPCRGPLCRVLQSSICLSLGGFVATMCLKTLRQNVMKPCCPSGSRVAGPQVRRSRAQLSSADARFSSQPAARQKQDFQRAVLETWDFSKDQGAIPVGETRWLLGSSTQKGLVSESSSVAPRS